MSYTLNNLKRPNSHKRKQKRVGRGNSSGKGTYSARGLKGQKARSGGRSKLARRSAFQQLLIRTPKLRGFKRQGIEYNIVNLKDLDKAFKDGDSVDQKALRAKGLVGKGPVKILGTGKFSKKLTIKAQSFSASAALAIKKLGGEAIILGK